MAYVCELGTNQKIYLDNQGMQTVVTSVSSNLGQQQQSSSSFSTGIWASPPELFQMPNGIAIKISTAQGESWIQIQGNSISVMSGNPSVGSSQQIQVQQTSHAPGFSMQPMQPMQPMKMGDMTMNLNPMEMKMGNMEMRMSSTPSGKRRFCSQCGASVKESDRFCSSCGNALN